MKYKHVFSICAYQDSPYLEQCIRSLMGQRVPSHVILCTSTPSAYIDGLAEKYGICVYVRDGKSSIGDDWNFAYAMAEAELVTIAHQDDVYHRDYSACLLEAYRKYPDLTVFTTDYVIIKKGKLVISDRLLKVKRLLRLPLRIPALNSRSWVKRLPFLLGNPVCCPATTYHKKHLGEPLVKAPYRFVLDWDTMVRLAGEKGRLICLERPLLYYRVHDGSATKACMEDNQRIKEEREMFSRFWPEPVVRLLMKLYGTASKEYQ